jgi:hypothetical protein
MLRIVKNTAAAHVIQSTIPISGKR